MSPLRKIAGLLHESNNLKQAVGILFVTVLISNALGLIRNIVIANRVGVTYGTIGPLDNYYAAFVLPDLIYNFLIVGALSSAVLPLLVKIDSEGDQTKFWRTFNVLISTGFAAIVVAIVVLFALLPWLINLVLPGFPAEDVRLTTELARVLMLSPLFFTVSQLSTSALQAKKFFFAPALAPIVYNLAIISGAVLIPNFGLPVLVFGVIVGAAAHFLVQLPTLIRLGWRFKFELGFGNETVRKVFTLMIPRAIALTSNQLLLLAFYRIASRLQEGSIAIYRLVDDLQTAPVLLLANTLAMAVLPDFARHIAKEDRSQFEFLVGKSIRLLIFIFIPISTFVILFRDPIMHLYISVGHSIDSNEVSLAIQTFYFFALSLFFQGAVLILARAHFAKSDTLRPTIYGIISLLCAWIIARVLTAQTDLGVAGLAAAFSAGSFINAILLWISLRLPLKLIFRDEKGHINLVWIVVSSFFAGLVFLLGREVGSEFVRQTVAAGPSIQNLIEIIFGFLLGALAYLSLGKMFKLEQLGLIRYRQK